MTSHAYGIDLGTTFSCVSIVNDNGDAEVIRNSEGQTATPSVVLFAEEGTYVGQQAKAQRVMYADDVVEFVKRQMGNASWRAPAPDGTEHTPETISSVILRKLVDDANDILGKNIRDVVVTVPAYFDDSRRTATKQAAEIAGLNLLEMINEPTAAALSFGVGSDFNGSLLVYDLGGGTFDVTLVDVSDGVFTVVGTDGERNLGGRNWDDLLINYLRSAFQDRTGIEISRESEDEAMLRDRAEAAKMALTQSSKTAVFISHSGRNEKVVVTRDEFEQLTKDLLDRTKWLIEDVMEAAGRTVNSVDKLLLVGGSTRMPMVSEMISSTWGITPDKSVHPDEAVALGAALHAAQLSGSSDRSAEPSGNPWREAPGSTTTPGASAPEFIIHDVTSHGVGVVALNAGGVAVNNVMIPAQTTIPTHVDQVFYTQQDNQREWEVEVTVGDEENLDLVTVIGTSTISLPPMPADSGMRIFFHYDVDGMIHVEVEVAETGQALGEFPVQREGALDDEDMRKFLSIVKGMDIQ